MEQRMEPVKEKDYCSEERMEALTVTADHLEHSRVSVKQKAGQRAPNLVSLIPKGCYWEPRKDSLTQTADHLGRWKEPLKAMDCCLEQMTD